MAIILAIETSAETASVALWCNGEVISRSSLGVKTHSETVLPMVQEVLAQSGKILTHCDAIAFGSGPGSFTGVRTACGVAQGLAFGADLPVISVSTLQAMACASFAQSPTDYDVMTLIDARMGEIYWAQYRYQNGWQIIIEPTLSAPSEVIPKGEVVVVGNGWQAYSSSLLGLKEKMRAHDSSIMPNAHYVAQLAENLWGQGKGVPAREAQPFYLRQKVALTRLERQKINQGTGT